MKKILIIEDDDEQRQLIEDILKMHSYETVSVDSGRGGILIAKKIFPDLIICDVMMPGYDGYKVLSELQKEKKTASIPFIFLTAKSDRSDIRKGMESGADDYIVKPFNEQELLNAVSARLKKRENTLLVSRKKAASSSSESSRPDQEKKLDTEDRILLTIENQPKLLKIDNIKCINAVGDYSNIITTESRKYFVRKTMKDWEHILPDKNFIRIHRSTIINLDTIEKIEKWFNRAYKVYLQNINKPFIISRRYGMKLRGRFS